RRTGDPPAATADHQRRPGRRDRGPRQRPGTGFPAAGLNMSVRHFLTLLDLSSEELQYLIRRGIELKAMHTRGEAHEPLRGKVLAMIFEKSSTRTRVSFEAGTAQLGGQAMFLSPRDTQLGRGEPVEDSARVLSSMVDIIMIRTFDHDTVQRF